VELADFPFAKYQVLFANGAAFEQLSAAQREILRQAAIGTKAKAIAEHPTDMEAAMAWCAEGGSIVLALAALRSREEGEGWCFNPHTPPSSAPAPLLSEAAGLLVGPYQTASTS